jgi:fermentation-respiration switch protein FrsA (DUF1100 family)
MPNILRRACAILSVAFLFAAAPPAGAAQLTEAALLRPIPGGTVTQGAVSAVAPAYRVTDHTIVAADGARLHAVLLRQPNARGTILYFGGNGYTIERFGALAAAVFGPLGVDLMIVDHRGYGMSQGRPTVAALETDSLTVYDYLAALPGIDRARIIVHGQSLGSFTAGHVAAHRQTAGVVLESTITSAEQWAAAMIGEGATIDEALRGRGNLRYMPGIAEPLLLLVGADDRVTPASFSQALFDASPLPAGRKILAVIPGAGHNDALARPEALAAYRRFLAGTLGNR